MRILSRVNKGLFDRLLCSQMGLLNWVCGVEKVMMMMIMLFICYVQKYKYIEILFFMSYLAHL